MAHQFKKKFGQNFLKDKKYVNYLVDSLEVEEGDIIVEIGPGDGSVTSMLLELNVPVICIEVDYSLLPNLIRKFSKNPNFNLIHEDILNVKLEEILLEKNLSGNIKFAGSLPYNISKKIIENFLKWNFTPSPENAYYAFENKKTPPSPIGRGVIKKMSFIVQDEVAKDYVARAPKASFLHNFALIYSNVKKLQSIPAEKFHPKPKVDGGIITFTLKDKPEVENFNDFAKLIKLGYSSPRKSLSNNIGNANKYDPEKIKEIDSNMRAAEVEFEDWVKLYNNLNLQK